MATPRKPRATTRPTSRSQKHYQPEPRALPLLADPTKPEHLDAIRRIAAMSDGQHTALRLNDERGGTFLLDRLMVETLHSPKLAASLVEGLLWELGICAKTTSSGVVEYTVDPAFGPARRPNEAPRATRRSLCLGTPTNLIECDRFVSPLVLTLTDLVAYAEHELTRARVFTALARPDEPTGDEREYVSDAVRSTARLVMQPSRWGMRVLVRDDEPCMLDIARNTPDEAEPTPEQTLVESLYAASGIKPGGCMRIVPNEFGWAISEVDAEPSVTISSSIVQTDVVTAVRDLYAAMDNDTLEPRPIDLTTEQAVMVHGNHGPKAGTFAEDIGDTLDTIEELIERLPGDPGPTCKLARRIEDVLKELQRRAGARS